MKPCGELFGNTDRTTGIDEPLRVKQFPCGVLDTLAAKEQSGMCGQDDAALGPLHMLQRRSTDSRRQAFSIMSMADGAGSAPLKTSLSQQPGERRELAVSHDDDNLNIFDAQQLAETLHSTEALRHA